MNADATAGASRRPTLAFVHHPQSFPAFQLAQAAEGVCRIAWVVDSALGLDGARDGVRGGARGSGLDAAPGGALGGAGIPGRILARLGAVVDVAGMDVEQAARAVGELRPDGILTLKDSRMPFTAALAARLGLPFHTPEVATRLTDKYAQRAALRDGGVPVPGFHTVPPHGDADAWRELARQLSFPAVLKPRVCNEASRDTVRVESAELAREAATLCGDREFVLEEYLADRSGGVRSCFADYVSVESVVSHGRISHVAVNGRFPPAEPFRESGFFIDAELAAADRRAALSTATQALTALGIQTGCPHTEIKFTPAGPRVIEVNGRIGGGVPEMLADISDLALLRVAFRIALGEQVSYDGPLRTSRVGFLFYVHAPSWMRRVTGVRGADRLGADPDVTELILSRTPGQAVDWREGNHGYVFSVRGTVADHDALELMDQRVHSEVVIEGE